MSVQRLVAGGCALALAIGLGVGASGCSTSGASATGHKGYVSGDGSVVVISVADRKTAPVLAGPLLGGGQGDLSHDKGRIIVLNLWGSWCAPCRKEAPDLAAAARALPAVAFMGINTRDVASNAEAFVRAEKIPYPSFADQDGSLVLEMQRVVNMSSLPITVILDQQGRVAAAIYGATTTITIEDIVAQLEREA